MSKLLSIKKKFQNKPNNIETQRNETEYKDLLKKSSNTIKVCRVICILTMAYTHIFLFSNESFSETTYFKIAQSLMIDLFGRSSVPLLSLLSGFLMIQYFNKRTLKAAIQDRFMTLIVPFIIWNIIGTLMHGLTKGLSNIDFTQGLFGLTGSFYYLHLTFLRDIFVISIATPVLVYLIKRFGLKFIALIIIYISFFDLFPIILRDQILLYFTLGIYFGTFRVNKLFTSHWFIIGVATSIFLLVSATLIHQVYPESLGILEENFFDNIFRRPICTVSFWYLAIEITKLKAFTAFISKHIEPAIYLTFLSHVFTSTILGSIYFQLESLHSALIFFLIWIFMPIICLIISITCIKALKYFPKSFSVFMTGKYTRN